MLDIKTDTEEKILTPVCVVPLGPGNPEDLTLGCWHKLQAADLIFCPSTLSGESKARQIMLAVGIKPEQIRAYPLPMSKDRTAALRAYDKVTEEAAENYRLGLRVVITAEGDAGLYSSSGYIFSRLDQLGVQTERKAGIPAFVAAAALSKVILTEGDESLLILPIVKSAESLLNQIDQGATVVLMKCSQSVETIKSAIRKRPDLNWHYFESVGYAQEYCTSSVEEIIERSFPYFSLIIVRR
ncbi:precorrin-2 C(20)-methyltransferase [Porphyromonas crevioricanis]|nr:precorrin-2 C(20)-methyltransferase [Porphyromonas crevioricanis]GAD05531.1 cobalt-precorrin-2 C20-methyltransferase [Porphyromonas crevioricanis JCM 15906]GAD08174.1 cobalt-precorrin-2 C20-methyltransferase [Porphyromonas crevioricanis JCM 13913]